MINENGDTADTFMPFSTLEEEVTEQKADVIDDYGNDSPRVIGEPAKGSESVTAFAEEDTDKETGSSGSALPLALCGIAVVGGAGAFIYDMESIHIAAVSESEIKSTFSSKSTSMYVTTVPLEITSSRIFSYDTPSSVSNTLVSYDFSSETTKELASEIDETSTEIPSVSDSAINFETTLENRATTFSTESNREEKPVAGGGFQFIISVEDNVKYLDWGLFSISVDCIAEEVTDNFILDYNQVVYSVNPDVLDKQYINDILLAQDQTEECRLYHVYINESYSFDDRQIILDKLVNIENN